MNSADAHASNVSGMSCMSPDAPFSDTAPLSNLLSAHTTERTSAPSSPNSSAAALTSYYLSILIDKFDGDETAALMAYNAGEANARKFLRGEPIFPETQKYLKDLLA